MREIIPAPERQAVNAEETEIIDLVVTNMSSDADNVLKFSVRLLIKHPEIDPARITAKLKLAPHLSWLAGDERKTPAGNRLPGTNKISTWSYSFDVVKTRHFFRRVSAFLKKLEPNKNFFHQLTKSGGSIILIVDLPGDTNIGDVLSSEDLQRLSALRISLGIEVFPHFRLSSDTL